MIEPDLLDRDTLVVALREGIVVWSGQTYDVVTRPARGDRTQGFYHVAEIRTRDGRADVVAKAIDTYTRGAVRGALSLLFADEASTAIQRP